MRDRRCIGESLLPLLPLLLLLLLLACATPTPVLGKKELERFPPIDGVARFVKRELCERLVREAQELTDAARQRVQPKRLAEDHIVEEIIEPLCNPLTTQGRWLRTLDIIAPEAPDAAPIALRVQPGPGKCKSKCSTLAELCTSIVDAPSSDELPALLYRGAARERLERVICGGKERDAPSRAQWPKVGDKTLSLLAADGFELADSKEMEIEAMMDDMNRKRGNGMPGYDVFSRDEMQGMQDAMREGDYERLQELDPQAGDLSEEDFEMLREIQNAEKQQDEQHRPSSAGVEKPDAMSSGSSSTSSGWLETLRSWIPL